MRTRDEIEERLKELKAEEKALLAELATLEIKPEAPLFTFPLGELVREHVPKSAEEKLALFKELFACREDVYPKLWQNQKSAAKGYSPACDNEWVRGICDKPRVKCSECPNQAFPALDSVALRRHLEGHETIGTYAIRVNDSYVSLATDFDGGNYIEEALAFKQAAREVGIAAEIERSRSGQGAHVWIFFSEPMPASIARKLGTIILSRATAIRHTIDLKAFDRFFQTRTFSRREGSET